MLVTSKKYHVGWIFGSASRSIVPTTVFVIRKKEYGTEREVSLINRNYRNHRTLLWVIIKYLSINKIKRHCNFDTVFYIFSFSMSLFLSSLSAYHHFLFLLLTVSPNAVLSKPKYPNTVSAASRIISRYFSLSYSSPCLIRLRGVTLKSGLLCCVFVCMYWIFSPRTNDLPASFSRIEAETCGKRLLYLSMSCLSSLETTKSCISISPVMTLSIVLVTSKRVTTKTINWNSRSRIIICSSLAIKETNRWMKNEDEQ